MHAAPVPRCALDPQLAARQFEPLAHAHQADALHRRHGVDLEPDARLRTLRDPATGASLAVFTQSQLEILAVTPLTRTIELNLPTVKALRWQPENLDLAVAGKWLLDEQDARTFALD